MRRIIFAALLLAGCQTSPTVIEPTTENVARQFEAAAFGNDFREGRGIVQRWSVQPVVGGFDTGDDDHHRAFAKRHSRQLGEAILSVQATAGPNWSANPKSDDDVNFRVGFMPHYKFDTVDIPGDRSVRSDQACMGFAFGEIAAGKIHYGVILIGTDIPEDQRRHCILEEVYQMMGLPADACHYRPSVICEQDRVFELTEADKILLHTLYDPRLKPGMTKAEAMPIARQIIAEQMR